MVVVAESSEWIVKWRGESFYIHPMSLLLLLFLYPHHTLRNSRMAHDNQTNLERPVYLPRPSFLRHFCKSCCRANNEQLTIISQWNELFWENLSPEYVPTVITIIVSRAISIIVIATICASEWLFHSHRVARVNIFESLFNGARNRSSSEVGNVIEQEKVRGLSGTGGPAWLAAPELYRLCTVLAICNVVSRNSVGEGEAVKGAAADWFT